MTESSALEEDNRDRPTPSPSHTAAKVEKNLAALVACERAMRSPGGGRLQDPLRAIVLAEQIGMDAGAALLNMAPEVVSEAKQMEIALDRLSNLLSDSSMSPDPARIVNARQVHHLVYFDMILVFFDL